MKILGGIATRRVVADAWDAAQRRAGETGALAVNPAAMAGELLESHATTEAAIAVAMVHAATMSARGEEKAANFWLEVRDEIVAVRDHEAEKAKESA